MSSNSTPLLQELDEDADEVGLSHRVVIELVGEDEEPIPWAAYRLIDTDGRTRTGRLDCEGRAEFDDLAVAGEYRVCFPELDEDAWEHVSSQTL